MTLRDCSCRTCLCYRGTRDEGGTCRERLAGRHPGDPRSIVHLPSAVSRSQVALRPGATTGAEEHRLPVARLALQVTPQGYVWRLRA